MYCPKVVHTGTGVSWQILIPYQFYETGKKQEICHAISVISGSVLNIHLLKAVRGFYCMIDKGLGNFFVTCCKKMEEGMMVCL